MQAQQAICDSLVANDASFKYLTLDLLRDFTDDESLQIVFRYLRYNHTVEEVQVIDAGDGLMSVKTMALLSRTVISHPSVRKLCFCSLGPRSRQAFPAVIMSYMQNPGLTELEFSSFTLDHCMIDCICTLLETNALESLEVGCCRWSTGLAFSGLTHAFHETTSLKKLRITFGDNYDSLAANVEIPVIIRGNKSLESLELIPHTTIILPHVAYAATGHVSLKHFKFEMWGFENIDEESAIVIGRLVRSPVLEVLELKNCNIRPRCADYIADGLEHRDCHIQTLRLEHCGLGNHRARSIAAALHANRNLKHLHLPENRIGNDGAIALGSMLEQNNAIVTLDLRDNCIGHEGSLALANSSNINNMLREIDLTAPYDEDEEHHVGDEAASRFARMLEQHSNVVERIGLKGFGEAGLYEFIARIPNMASVVKLGLHTDDLPPQTKPALVDALLAAIEQNTILLELELPTIFVHDVRFQAAESTMKYLFDLNRAGRRIIRGTPNQPPPNQVPLGLWPRILGRDCCSDDATFYFLRKKPEMVRNYHANRKRSLDSLD